MSVDAPNPLAASGEILEIFRNAVARCGTADAPEASIVDLHAELAPEHESWEPELQTA
jgi:hypothetical protein